MENNIRLQFDSSIENIKDVNESFASGALKICYTGVNRNRSMISRSSIERAIPSMFNCPIVCNYDVEADTIGGHDVDVVTTDDGDMRLINLTNAVGVVPSGANVWWSIIEDDGKEHEYISVEVILWKRSPAYQKIINDGIVSQSMEISVKNGQVQDGIFVIEDFIFTAFCLLGEGVEPCFESASLQMFDKNDVAQQFTAMMQEFKETFSIVTDKSDNDTVPQNNSTKGGAEVLELKIALMSEYGLTEDQLDFNLNDFELDELKEKFEAIKKQTGEPNGSKDFALAGQITEALVNAISVETIETCLGTMERYWYVDRDDETMEVYCYDAEDWNLYGFPYSMNGDNAVVDFACKKRKKYTIADFDEGEQPSVFANVFEVMTNKFNEKNTEWTEKYQNASNTITSMETELGELRQFKADTDSATALAEREKVFEWFEDLYGVEAFESLRNDCENYSVEDLEEKCYAIRGRNSSVKFNLETPRVPKLPVGMGSGEPEPYGGLFSEFGIHPKNSNN